MTKAPGSANGSLASWLAGLGLLLLLADVALVPVFGLRTPRLGLGLTGAAGALLLASAVVAFQVRRRGGRALQPVLPAIVGLVAAAVFVAAFA
jgi:hypothetical protein